MAETNDEHAVRDAWRLPLSAAMQRQSLADPKVADDGPTRNPGRDRLDLRLNLVSGWAPDKISSVHFAKVLSVVTLFDGVVITHSEGRR